MNYRNPTYNAFGTIDVEIEHPVYGWIPFTTSPDDVEEHGRNIYDAIIASGDPVAPYVPAPQPDPVPQIIPRRQFYQGLAVAGLITKEEALDALTGTLPPALVAIVNSIPDEDAAFAATAHLLASGEFDRAHPLIPVFAASQGMSSADVDDFWRLCASLV